MQARYIQITAIKGNKPVALSYVDIVFVVALRRGADVWPRVVSKGNTNCSIAVVCPVIDCKQRKQKIGCLP